MTGSAHAGSSAPATGAGRPSAHRRVAFIAVTAVVVLALDQLSKWWAINTLTTQTIPVVWTLRFNLAYNTGAAFSVGRGTDWGRFIPLLALVVVGLVLWQGPRTVSTRLGALAVGMIVGGAVGNLADRAFRADRGGFFSGAVIDFIDFQWWPIFNVADMGVVVGGFLLVAVSFRVPEDDPAEGDAGTGAGADTDAGVNDTGNDNGAGDTDPHR